MSVLYLQPMLYFCGCNECRATWTSWGIVGEGGLLYLDDPDCPVCKNDDYTQAEPNEGPGPPDFEEER